MKLIDTLRVEFDHEAQTTRRHLERLPADKLDWQPHEKSFTAAGLASHIVEMASWGEAILKQDGLDFDPATYKPYLATSVEDLLTTFDDNVARGKQALDAATDDTLEQSFSFKIMGQVQFERSRADTFRDVTLNHIIHHRGQLSVYLRLLNVAVPGSYGPSADEA
ncbi:MAG TPA: DinB family protein [Pyrinomonadaceae bacterium]|nr:DinB family protein [Pyrinomonadaceae bacterium]